MSSSQFKTWTCHDCGENENIVGTGGSEVDMCTRMRNGRFVCAHNRCFKVIDHPGWEKPCGTHWMCHLCNNMEGTENEIQHCQTRGCGHLRCEFAWGPGIKWLCPDYFRCHECNSMNYKDSDPYCFSECAHCGHMQCLESNLDSPLICLKRLEEEGLGHHGGAGQYITPGRFVEPRQHGRARRYITPGRSVGPR